MHLDRFSGLNSKSIGLVAFLAFLGCSGGQMPVRAETGADAVSQARPIRVSQSSRSGNPAARSAASDILNFVQPQAAKKQAPGRRAGGGNFSSDEACKLTNPPLTALVPGSEDRFKQTSAGAIASQGVLSLTAEAYPTFWFYLPYEGITSLPVEFVLIDSDDEPIAEGQFQITGTPGVVKISAASPLLEIPQNQPLALDQDYRWSFSVICNEQDQSANIYVEGWIQRIRTAPTLATELAAATPTRKAFIYAREGLWPETLNALATEVCATNPAKAESLMADLLRSVGLRNIAEQPHLKCPTARQN